MKQSLLALGALSCVALSGARAEYLRITYFLSPDKPAVASMTVADAGPGFDPEAGGGGGRRRGRGGNPGGGPRPPQPTVSRDIKVESKGLKAEAIVEYRKFTTGVLASQMLTNTFASQITGKTMSAKLFPVIFHKWGKTALIANADIRLAAIQEKGIALPPVEKRYRLKRIEMLKGIKPEDQGDKLIELAKWALAHGMTDEIPNIMDEVARIKNKDANLTAIFTTYETMKAAMQKTLPKDEARYAQLRERYGNLRLSSNATKHYAVLYSVQSETQDVTNFISRLEEHYRGFFYWFAIRAINVPVPDHRLVTILTDKPQQFQFLKQIFDNPVQVEDGFCARRENILVCSSVRMDLAFEALTRATQGLWQSGWSKEKLLQGAGRENAIPEEIARNQILALLLKAMQEESNLATVSNLGTEQLITAIGKMPHNVMVPQWFMFGCCSYFETPKGAYWAGIGAPSWRYLAKWKAFEEGDKLLPSDEAMREVVTDGMFNHALETNAEEDWLTARTYSWSLVYFLIDRHMDGVSRFFEEINALPRDMLMDPETLKLCYARAFDVVSAQNHSEIDEVKWKQLAREWYDYIHYTNFEASEAFIDAMQELKLKLPAEPREKDVIRD